MQTQSKSLQDSNNQSGGITQILFRYIPYWPLFLGLLIIGMAAAWLYLRYTIPVYESSATILLKDDNRGQENSQILSSLSLFGSKKIVENEIEVIRSRAVMRDVVKNLGLYAPIFIDGKINAVSAYVTSPIKIFLKNPDSLIAQDKIYFTYDEVRKQVLIKGDFFPVNQWINTKWGTLQFVPNRLYRSSVEKRPLFFYLMDVKGTANGILAGLQVLPASKMATVVNLRIYDQVPERGEDILNELVEVYNSFAIQDKNQLAANALAFVTERLELIEAELDSVEKSVQKYKSTKGIVDISAQGHLFLQSVENNDQKVSDISVELSILDQVEKYVEGKDANPGIVPSTAGLSDGMLTQLLGRLYETEIQYEKLRKTTGENSSVLVSLRDQIDKIKPSIKENIRNQRNNLLASRANLSGTSERYSSMLRTLPEKERQLVDISRSQSIKKNIYEFLLQKREEAALSYASTVADSRLVDRAESGTEPVSPKRNLVYGIACLLALSVPIGFVSLKELFNKKIFFRSEIDDLISFPVIGEISQDNTRKEIVMGEGERSFVAEQFRQIRTTLPYLGIDGKVKKKILVTSSISGEGKSFIAANLAMSLALTDKKVVLIEMDLRKPKLGEIFNGKNKIGISDFLKGKAGKEQIINPTGLSENLFVIFSGSSVNNPSELLLNAGLKELLDYLEKSYDYIVMETGPVNAVTDAFIISNLSDATLFIIRHNFTAREHINIMKDHLKVRELKNPAIIFNGVKAVGFGKYGSLYNYAEKTGKKKEYAG